MWQSVLPWHTLKVGPFQLKTAKVRKFFQTVYPNTFKNFYCFPVRLVIFLIKMHFRKVPVPLFFYNLISVIYHYSSVSMSFFQSSLPLFPPQPKSHSILTPVFPYHLIISSLFFFGFSSSRPDLGLPFFLLLLLIWWPPLS